MASAAPARYHPEPASVPITTAPAPPPRVGRRNAIVCFYFAVALALSPVWWFPHFPSTDGPSHLYNSYVFLHYAAVPEFQRAFTVQVPSEGNLAGHGLAMLFLLAGATWSLAEKLLINICVLGLAGAFHYAVFTYKEISPVALFLVLPFLFNWPLQMGFWSFSLGVPLVLVSMGLSLRYQSQWTPRRLVCLFAAAGVAYLCHPVTWAIAALLAGVYAIAAEWPRLLRPHERRRTLLQLALPVAMFVPFAAPILIFAGEARVLLWDPFVFPSQPALAGLYGRPAASVRIGLECRESRFCGAAFVFHGGSFVARGNETVG